MIHHIARVSRHCFFWSLLALAVGLTGLRLMLAGMDHYKANLAAHISQMAGTPVSIGHLRARLKGFNPELILDDIAVQSQDGPKTAVALREIRLGVNVPEMLASQDWLSSVWVTLIGVKLSVYRKDDGSFAVLGLHAGGEQPNWLWQGHKLQILESEIAWYGYPDQQHPLILQAVDVAVINQGQSHRLNALANLPAYYGQSLTFSAAFTGNPFASAGIDGKVFAQAKQFKLNSTLLKAWANKEGAAIQTGQADVRLWSQFRHSHLVTASGDVAFQNVQVSGQNQRRLAINSLQTVFAWQKGLDAPGGWQLAIPYFSLHINGKPQSSGAFNVSVEQTDKPELQRLALFMEHFDVRQAVLAMQFFAPWLDEKVTAMIPAEANGTVDKLALWADFRNHTAAIKGDFNNIGSEPVAALPGFDNISGHIQGNQQNGKVLLSTREAHFKMPTIFREVLAIKKLQGTLQWEQKTEDLQLSSRNLAVDLQGIQTFSQLQFKLGQPNHPPFLDLQMALACDDVRQLKHYYPVGVMQAPAIDWLDRAFMQGQITSGEILYMGYLGQPLAAHVRDIETVATVQKTKAHAGAKITSATPPNRGVGVGIEQPGGGIFEALLEVGQLQLDYAPDWPPISNISGQVRFLQDWMKVTADDVHSNRLTANKVTVINPAVGISKWLFAKGQIDGEIADVFAFLKNTPLRGRIGTVADAISTQGHTQVSLDMALPFVPELAPKVDGKATLHQAGLNVLALALPVDRINGILKFDEQGIYSDTINARTLKYPVRIKLTTTDGQTSLQAQGHAELTTIEQQFGLPHTAVANGGLDYQLDFRWPMEDRPSDLSIESNLAGVELKLAGPLAKPRDGQQNLKIDFNLADRQSLPIGINYADILKAALQYDTAKKRLVAGHIVLGAGEASPQKQLGYKLDINLQKLNLKDLLSWAGAGVDGGTSDGSGIREINVHSDDALWGQKPLGLFDLTLKAQSGQWRGHLASSFAVGNIDAPLSVTPDGIVGLDLDLLDMSAIKELHGESSPSAKAPTPQTQPLLAIHCAHTLWRSLDLGVLALETEHRPDGIAIKTFHLDSAAQKLQLWGDWTTQGPRQQTRLRGHLGLPDAGATLAKLDLSHDLADTNAAVEFSGGWEGTPGQFSLAALQGQVSLHFSEGRILSIEPGLGRILGVLAMEQWLKRLQLDFRDIFAQGLTFDAIDGHFDIANGKAVTHDLRVDAVPAKITLTGTADFIGKTVDQQVNVIPKSADALPIAGTIVDKFTLLLAHTLTGADQDGFFLGTQYRLKGSWNAIQVLPLHEKEGVVPKIWNGLTDFSWLQQTSEQPSK